MDNVSITCNCIGKEKLASFWLHSQDEHGRFMMDIITVCPWFATGLKEEVEEVHELTSYNSVDLMKANPKLVLKKVAVIKICKNKKIGKLEAYKKHGDVYEPEYDGDKNKKRKPVNAQLYHISSR